MLRPAVLSSASFAGLVVLGLGGVGTPLPPLRVPIAAVGTSAKGSPALTAPCPIGTLPDGQICVHIPTGADGDDPESPSLANGHHTRNGRWQVYEDIPRRPDRPSDYDLYRYPVPPGLPGGHSVVSGFDLDKPDEAQRRGRTLHAVGHGGVDLPQARGTPIHLVALDHQQGDAEVLFIGPLFGTTVITRQTVREGGRSRDYVMLFGHMDSVATDVVVGKALNEGDVVGYVGDTGSPELIHLHLEARRVRDGVDVHAKAKAGGAMLLADEVSIVCDPRNVLPLR